MSDDYFKNFSDTAPIPQDEPSAPVGSADTEATELQSYKDKYGKVYRLQMTLAPDDTTEIEVSYVFRKPTTQSYDRYIKTMSNSMSKASNAFLMDNIIPEHLKKLEDGLEEYPALAISAADKLLTMLGLSKISNLTKL